MGISTGIEWTSATWNPWMGCVKISPGCKNCYMFREMGRYGMDPKTVARSKTKFRDPLKWQKGAEREGRRLKVFTCSWSDWFIGQADDWRAEAWKIVRDCPNLDFQILTKRPERIADRLPADWGTGYPNVWLGVTAENQETAQERIPILIDTPATVRFLSLEPLLSPILIGDVWYRDLPIAAIIHSKTVFGHTIHWVIAGGETGRESRPGHPDWFRSIRDECEESSIPFFFKQWGDWAPVGQRIGPDFNGDINARKARIDLEGRDVTEQYWFHDDTDATLFKIGKHAAGAKLDGIEHRAFPRETA